MGVYVRGMEMPESCFDCNLCYDAFYCMALKIGFYVDRDKEYRQEGFDPGTARLQGCPLVPVPEHVRLIDADALAEHKFVCTPHVTVNDVEAGVAYRLGWNTAIEAIIENAETVIGGE